MSVSKATSVIQLAVLYIKNDNIDKLEQVLRVMPLESLKDNSEDLLASFLGVCASYDRPEIAKLILERWKVIYPEEDKIQILSRLFLINKINLPTLSFVVLKHIDYTYVELMDDLIEFDSSPEVITACQKADEIFGAQPYETYKIVQEHAYELDNDNVYDYATDRMQTVAPYAPVPGWVKNYYNGPLMTESELYKQVQTGDVSFEIPPDTEAVEILIGGLSHVGISVGDLENVKQYLLQKLSTSTRQEKIDMLKPIMENTAQQNLSGDVFIFRVFGPANPLVDQDLTLNTPSAKYGGCRMFLCDVFDFNTEEDYVEDWFGGVCEQCNLRIRHRWHAVRKPRVHGGFVGCYCNWGCVRESVFWDGEEPNLLAHELIDIFEKEVTETGIQDRLEG